MFTVIRPEKVTPASRIDCCPVWSTRPYTSSPSPKIHIPLCHIVSEKPCWVWITKKLQNGQLSRATSPVLYRISGSSGVRSSASTPNGRQHASARSQARFMDKPKYEVGHGRPAPALVGRYLGRL